MKKQMFEGNKLSMSTKIKNKVRAVKKIVVLVMCVAVLMSLVACGDQGTKSGSDEDKNTVIRIGSKDFTEGMIVSEVYALALEDAGYKVDRMFNIAGSVIHTALVNDEIDIYPEYTGTGLLSVLGMEPESDPKQVYDIVKAEYEKKFQLIWLDYSSVNNGQGLAIRSEIGKKLGIETISDLQKYATQLRFASQGEFDERQDGIPALERVYGKFDWKSTKIYDSGIKYEVLSKDQADVCPVYTTEGQLADEKQFTLLKDDLNVWPPYNLAPVVRENVLKSRPDIAEILNKISASMDTESMTKLNARVDIDKEETKDVAKEYYKSIK